ncbi:hypothetical protein V5O48_015213, partial [Marasmius crinis-equi]
MFPQRVLIFSVYLTLLGLRVTSLPLSGVQTTEVDIANNGAVPTDTFISDGLITRDDFGNSDVYGAADFNGIELDDYDDEDDGDSEQFTIERRAKAKAKAKKPKPAAKKAKPAVKKVKPTAKKAPAAKPAKKAPAAAKKPQPKTTPAKAPAAKKVPAKVPAKKTPAKAPAKTPCTGAAAKPGAKGAKAIEVAGKSLKLGKKLGRGAFASGNFFVKVPEQPRDAFIEDFNTEIADTEKASSVLGSNLFVGKGVVNGVPVMVLNRVSGKQFKEIPLGAACEAKAELAAKLAKEQQTKLKNGAGFIQDDPNITNFLFNDDATELNMIDFGILKRGAQATDAQ